MTKQTIIIALIIIGLAYYYYQQQAKAGAQQQLTQLTSQLSHYRDLAQQKVTDYWQSHRATNLTELTEKITGQEQKITDLENALLNLAKQKIKGKKEAQILLNQLETNWKKEQASWQEEQKRLLANCETNYNLAQSQLAQLEQLTQELQTKKNWGKNHIPQLKQELFSPIQTTYQELKATIEQAYFVKGKSEVQQQLAELAQVLTENKPATHD